MRRDCPLFLETLLILGIVLSFPAIATAHVGHGDEFQAEGGIERVQVNSETDSLMGIVVEPIQPAADGSGAVFIPSSALVESDGKQLVFVQYENFYEPVPVMLGATQGERIEVIDGLSLGEQLVTQGSLSLYAESRKTQTAEAPVDNAAPPTRDVSHAQADAQGIPHSHDVSGNLVAGEDTAPSGGFSTSLLAALGGGVALLIGGIVFVSTRKK